MSETRVISVIGDSHTWGEGVGAEYGFRPSVVCADKRMTSFTYPNYVNLLRVALELKTGSHSEEIITDKLASLCGAGEGDFGILNPSTPLVLNKRFSVLRVFFCADVKPTKITVLVDKKKAVEEILVTNNPSMSVAVIPLTVRVNDDVHDLCILADGMIRIHRIELYSGEYALVNCGIGSCPVGKYVDTFFDRYVTSLAPYAAIFEGCTINDWLSGESTEEYKFQITRAIDRIRSLTPRILAHSVFPIGGSQVFGNNPIPYNDYADAMKQTLTSLNIDFVDSREEFLRELSRLSPEQYNRFLYHDPWHPNGTGHAIYARTVLPELFGMLGI